MGVAAEPGQKGINWSNIAVGELAASPRIYAHANVVIRWYHEHGMFFPKESVRCASPERAFLFH